MRTAASKVRSDETDQTGGMRQRRVDAGPTAFDAFHPMVSLCYVTAALVFCMAAMQPVYLLISFAGAFAYGIVLRGPRIAVRSLAWQLPPRRGRRVGEPAVFRVWLHGAVSHRLSCVLSRKLRVRLLHGPYAGNRVHAVLECVARSVFRQDHGAVRRFCANDRPDAVHDNTPLCRSSCGAAAMIDAVQRACTAARPACAEKGGTRLGYLRSASVLMGWSMEDSLETAAAMKAKGWGAGFATYDVQALSVSASRCTRACMGWRARAGVRGSGRGGVRAIRFYPIIEGVAPWWSYLPYAAFVALPLAMSAKERARWRP